jgi:hypothetical protein
MSARQGSQHPRPGKVEQRAASQRPRTAASRARARLPHCACAARPRPARVRTEVAGWWRQRRAGRKGKSRLLGGAREGKEGAEDGSGGAPGKQAEAITAGADTGTERRGVGGGGGGSRDCQKDTRGIEGARGAGVAGPASHFGERPVMAMMMAAVTPTAPVKLRSGR